MDLLVACLTFQSRAWHPRRMSHVALLAFNDTGVRSKKVKVTSCGVVQICPEPESEARTSWKTQFASQASDLIWEGLMTHHQAFRRQ